MTPETLAFYLLVRYYTDNGQSTPKAVGPFPSKALCVAAAHDISPGDRRFWPAKQRDAADDEDKARWAALDAAYDELRRTKPSKDGWYYINNGGRHYNANGENDGTTASGGWTGPITTLPPDVLTNCVTAFDPEVVK